MGRRRRGDRNRPDFNPIGSVDFEAAIASNVRPRKLTMAAADRQIASCFGHRQASAIAGPSAGRQRHRTGFGGATAGGEKTERDDAAAGVQGEKEISNFKFQISNFKFQMKN